MERRDFLKAAIAVAAPVAADQSLAPCERPPWLPNGGRSQPDELDRNGTRRDDLSPPGSDGRASVRAGTRRVPHRRAEGGTGEHPHHSHGHRPRHQLHGQLLGLPQRRQRDPHGQGPAGRLPAESLPDDEDRRPNEGVRRAANRRVAEAAADRSPRPAPVPRDHSPGRPGSDLRAGGGNGGGGGGAESGQDPLHRLHRPQGSAGASADAGGRRPAPLPFRCGADAAERHGRPFPQLSASRSCPCW